MGSAANETQKASPARTPTPKFLPLPTPIPTPTPASPVAAAVDIHIELQRGATILKVTWPVSSASEWAAWVREVLR